MAKRTVSKRSPPKRSVPKRSAAKRPVAKRSAAKRLVRHGNSLALVIDSAILGLLGIGSSTPLDLATDGERLIVSPRRPRAATRLDPQFAAALDLVTRKHAPDLRRLAEG